MVTPKKQKTLLLIDPKFHFHPRHVEIYKKVEAALKQFPEIKEVQLSAFYPKKNVEYEERTTIAVADRTKISFNMKVFPTYNNIYHELYHILQHQGKKDRRDQRYIETDATLLGMARMKKSHVENNMMTYFTDVPKSKVLYYAKMAESKKKAGDTNYAAHTYVAAMRDKKADLIKDPKNIAKWKPIHKHDLPVNAKFTVVRNGKNYVKGLTPDIVGRYVNGNIKQDQKLSSNLIQPKDGTTYAYEKKDLIDPSKWMKVTVTKPKPTVSKKAVTDKPKRKSPRK